MSVLSSAQKNITRINFLSYFEVTELPRLLLPGETVTGALSGFYHNGPATLCVTNQRMLLIDKKFIRLSIEDIRFDSVGEIQYSQQLFLSSLRLIFAGQTLQFRSMYRKELRAFIQYVQLRTLQQNAEESNPVHGVSAKAFLKSANTTTSDSSTELTMYDRLQKWRKVTEYICGLPLLKQEE